MGQPVGLLDIKPSVWGNAWGKGPTIAAGRALGGTRAAPGVDRAGLAGS